MLAALRFNAGFYGAVAPRLTPHPWCASHPAGKSPSAFPRPPFSAPARKIYLRGAFLNNTACVQRSPQSCGERFTRGRNARVHSAFVLTGKTNASLAPCALGGDRLAMSVCAPEVVSRTFGRPRKRAAACRRTSESERRSDVSVPISTVSI